jgi:hypothetical protein
VFSGWVVCKTKGSCVDDAVCRCLCVCLFGKVFLFLVFGCFIGESASYLRWVFLYLVVVCVCVRVCVCVAFVSPVFGFVVDDTAEGKTRVLFLVGDGELFGCRWMFAGEGVGPPGSGNSPGEGARDAVGKSKCIGAGGYVKVGSYKVEVRNVWRGWLGGCHVVFYFSHM